MTSLINKTYQLSLTTLTPVSIGGDQADTLSPYADYVMSEDGNYIRYINQSIVEKAVLEKGLLDEYVLFIQTGMDNNRSAFNLKQYIQDRLKLSMEEATWKKVVNHGLALNTRQEINPIIKSKKRPFIPGSSIKGAIRTAILYDWLVGKERTEPELRFYFEQLKRLEALIRNRGDFRQIRDIQRSLFNEEKLFGHLNKSRTGPDARRIKVSDTNFQDNSLGIYPAKRIRLKKGKDSSTIPIIREGIETIAPLKFSLSIEPPISNTRLQYLEKEDIISILNTLNRFTKDCIYNEIEELKLAHNPDFRREIHELLDFYSELADRAENGEIFLRLGFGKTLFDNSLILALFYGGEQEESTNAFYTYRKLMLRFKGHNDQLYPITRTVTFDNRPMGWVKIEPLT